MKELNILLNEIKIICKEKHISYSELSNMTDIPVSTLSKIMAGIIKDPSITSMIKITQSLGYSIDYLLGRTDTNTIKIPLSDKEETASEAPEILNKYNSLNSLGKQKADEYITDLSEQPKYTAE